MNASTQQAAVGRGALPDTTASAGPFRSYSSDPGRREAWWWLGVPLLLAAGIIAVHEAAPDFYEAWIIPEGYGFLEVGHFFLPVAAAAVAFRLLFRPFVRRRRTVFWFLLLMMLGCLYIAGEEHSWGQHFFYWDTPSYWAEINRQQETNVHNTSEWFNHKPRALMEIGIIAGGLLLPLAAVFRPGLRRNRWALFLPADALVPAALGMVLFKSFHTIEKTLHIHMPASRPAEATESFIYLFLLFYLIVFARRIGELEREAGG